MEPATVPNPHVTAMRDALRALGASTQGNSAALKKRLRKLQQRSSEAASPIQSAEDKPENRSPNNDVVEVETDPHVEVELRHQRQPFEYYCVFDVEATCCENNASWTHEIIEFPVVLVHAKTRSIVAEFRSFVRPTLNPTLTPFCTSLTGITQEQVSAAPTFGEVLRAFERFLSKHGVVPARMAFCTDGPWDVDKFVAGQCALVSMRMPRYFRPYVNVRRLYARFYGLRHRVGIAEMVGRLGLEFEGRAHSGIDDARNIARIVLRMMADGCVIECTK
ncbi:3'-5' exoribonuclease 1 [Entophlyctis sp. JEL0112]|nr:3'-5' exoribonuclease 1 [Entophlyctis sp. JEL0112]